MKQDCGLEANAATQHTTHIVLQQTSDAGTVQAAPVGSYTRPCMMPAAAMVLSKVLGNKLCYNKPFAQLEGRAIEHDHFYA